MHGTPDRRPGGAPPIDLAAHTANQKAQDLQNRWNFMQAAQNARFGKIQHAFNFLSLFREATMPSGNEIPAIPSEIDSDAAKAAREATFAFVKEYFAADTPLESGKWQNVNLEDPDESTFANAVKA